MCCRMFDSRLAQSIPNFPGAKRVLQGYGFVLRYARFFCGEEGL